MYGILAVLAAFALVYSIVAGRVERTWISGPMIFVAVGLLLGPMGLGLLSMNTSPEAVKTLAEFTLALVLFTGAAGANVAVIERNRWLPIRLLAVGLPLTILFGFGVGKLMFGALTIYEIAVLATMLAPTDADLGEAVVSNEAVPDRIRQGLNVESGLNDGICVPILLLFMTLAAGRGGGDESPVRMGLGLFAKEVGIGAGCGIAVTLAAVALLGLGKAREWLSTTWTEVTLIALAFTCFGSAQWLGGSGFIASFTGGLLFGGLFRPHHAPFLLAAEGVGNTFGLLTWIVFGSAVVGRAIGHFSWTAVVYALLSLTIIRMVPVYLCMMGSNVGTEGRLFMGWFGPRGLASIVFVIMVLDADLEHSGEMAMVVVCTVVLSIVLHGLTANPWAAALGRREQSP